MSLAKTLVKVAIGVAIVKGVSALTKGGSAQASPADDGRNATPGQGTRIDGRSKSSVPGGLDDLMSDVLRGGTSKPQGGDLLDDLTRTRRAAPRKTAPKGGMEDLLEQLTGGKAKSGSPSRGGVGGGDLGDLLGSVLGGAAARPGGLRIEEEQEISAALMLRAIIQAVKCDGELDAGEKQKLMEAMGDATQAEVKAVNAELARPVDVEGLARMVPAGLEPQVYLASLSAINLDQQAEAQYLHALAQALELQPHEVNALHDRLGAPHIYR